MRIKLYMIVLMAFFCHSTNAQISAVVFASGLNNPVDIKNCGDDRLFVVEQDGFIRIVDTLGNVNPVPFLDIEDSVNCCGERGLLGLAFAPDFLTSGYFYVNYTAIGHGDTRISRFKVDSLNPDLADPLSEEILLQIYQPYSNHNGGHLAFGPDGYLYIGMGDGGSGGDPQNRAQNTDSLLGKILRIGVDPTIPGYFIPSDNVFANDSTAGRPEIWAIGVRNPWRFSFDRCTGDLWIGDVGQGSWEEIDFEPAGSPSGINYGWRCYEGTDPYNTAGCLPQSEYTDPVHEYSHSNGCSVTGGYRYRGAKYNELYGKYFFTDYCQTSLRYLEDSAGSFVVTNLGSMPANSVTTFGEDRWGDIYLSGGGNTIYKLQSADCTPVAKVNCGSTALSDCGSGSVMLNAVEGKNFTYEWSYNGSVIAVDSLSITATQAGTYVLTVTSDTCSNSDSVTVSLGAPAPVSFLGLDTLYCIYHQSANLSPNILGGVFTGPGINGASFNPALAGEGMHTVIYTYTDPYGCISVDSQQVHVDLCVFVEENSAAHAFALYPNPASGFVTVSLFSISGEEISVRIEDLAGRLVKEEVGMLTPGVNEIIVRTGDLPAGIYFVNTGGQSQKLMIK